MEQFIVLRCLFGDDLRLSKSKRVIVVFALVGVKVHQTIGAVLIVFSALCLCGTSLFKIFQLFILSVLRTGLNVILR